MRRLIVPVLIAVVAWTGLFTLSCKRQDKARVEATEEEAPSLASIVHVADPQTAPQLLKGFYELEQNSWRWTMGKFSVILRPPDGAGEKGATLQAKIAVPDPVIDRLKSVVLTVAVGTATLPPEKFSKPGEYTFSRDVPASVLKGDSVVAQFSLDKFLAPGTVDQRELGIIVTTVGLMPK